MLLFLVTSNFISCHDVMKWWHRSSLVVILARPSHFNPCGPLIYQPCIFNSWWRHQMEIFSALLALCAGNSPMTGEFPAQRASNAELWCFLWSVNKRWSNNREDGGLRRHRAHYDATIMSCVPHQGPKECLFITLRGTRFEHCDAS